MKVVKEVLRPRSPPCLPNNNAELQKNELSREPRAASLRKAARAWSKSNGYLRTLQGLSSDVQTNLRCPILKDRHASTFMQKAQKEPDLKLSTEILFF